MYCLGGGSCDILTFFCKWVFNITSLCLFTPSLCLYALRGRVCMMKFILIVLYWQPYIAVHWRSAILPIPKQCWTRAFKLSDIWEIELWNGSRNCSKVFSIFLFFDIKRHLDTASKSSPTYVCKYLKFVMDSNAEHNRLCLSSKNHTFLPRAPPLLTPQTPSHAKLALTWFTSLPDLQLPLNRLST